MLTSAVADMETVVAEVSGWATVMWLAAAGLNRTGLSADEEKQAFETLACRCTDVSRDLSAAWDFAMKQAGYDTGSA